MELDFNSLLAISFTAWGGIVAYFAHGIRTDLRGIARNLADEAEKLNQYIVQTEARLAVLEDRVEHQSNN